ncbi:SRPBCC family protein [Paenibacillus lutrae]|uniref:Cell division protein n=1 Tax=Paenibacillus lutrae TaxID=2078573 RepID=A0A7X3FK28_9BACL|nr:SRPBCC family protein [Paenibacillus lutrae]MVP01168.1 cell division protein [Paenibacillus lutrae]
MIKVTTEIEIEAPIDRCFDLARNIDVHTRTVWKHTKEKAIDGTVTGCIGDGETVTFQATHLGVRQKLTSQITEFKRPYLFVDSMLRGAFKSLKHTHEFVELDDSRTLMKDTLLFEAPFGMIGWLVERLVLRRYMEAFINHRNIELKKIAEGYDDSL